MSARRRQIISLTPLIDVVFILLIFFMLASSFATWRSLPVNMAAGGGSGIADGKSVMVELREDGLRFGGRTVSRDELLKRLEARKAVTEDLRVLMRFDAALPLQQTVDMLDDLRAIDIREVRILPPRNAVQP